MCFCPGQCVARPLTGLASPSFQRLGHMRSWELVFQCFPLGGIQVLSWASYLAVGDLNTLTHSWSRSLLSTHLGYFGPRPVQFPSYVQFAQDCPPYIRSPCPNAEPGTPRPQTLTLSHLSCRSKRAPGGNSCHRGLGASGQGPFTDFFVSS